MFYLALFDGSLSGQYYIFYLLLYRQEAASARTVPPPGSPSGQLGLPSGVVPLAFPFEAPDVPSAALSCPSIFPVAGLVPLRPLNGTQHTAGKTVGYKLAVN